MERERGKSVLAEELDDNDDDDSKQMNYGETLVVRI